MKVLSAPQKVTLNITNRCNLNCLYCGVSSTKNAPGDLTLEKWKDIIEQLAQIKVFDLLISGGEPFLRNDFEDILKSIFKYHFRISINTNGTAFNKETILLLARSNRLDNIQVSIDGPTRNLHDYIRGKGAFKQVLEGLDILRSLKIPFSFFVVICKNNKDCLKDIVLFSKKTGARRIAFSSLLPQGSALSHLKDLFLSFEEQKRVEAELRLLNKAYPALVGGSLLQTIKWMNQISQIDTYSSSSGDANKISSCSGSITGCSIRPDGWVVPCDRLWDYKVGNLKKESFRNIWLYSAGLKEFRQRYSRDVDNFKECRKCTYTNICRGGCPSIPYYMGKGINGWDPFSCYMVFTGKKISFV